jgi:hypothetical protein
MPTARRSWAASVRRPRTAVLGSFSSRTAVANSGQQRTLPAQILLPRCFNTNNDAAGNWGLLWGVWWWCRWEMGEKQAGVRLYRAATGLGFTTRSRARARRTGGCAAVHERREAPARRRPRCDVPSLSCVGPSAGKSVRGGGFQVGQGSPGQRSGGVRPRDRERGTGRCKRALGCNAEQALLALGSCWASKQSRPAGLGSCEKEKD